MYKQVDAAFGCLFAWYGRKVGKYPWVFIFLCLLVNGLLGIGLLYMNTTNEMEKLYTPENSRSAQDRVIVENIFPDHSGDFFLSYQKTNDGKYAEIIVRSMNGSNALADSVWRDLTSVSDVIRNITVQDETDMTFSFQDVCAKRQGECVIDGDFLLSTEFREDYEADLVTYPFYFSQSYGPINLQRYFGNFRNTSIIEAEFLKIRYHLRQDSLKMADISILWQSKFVDIMGNLSETYMSIEMAYATAASLSEELDANTDGDVKLFSFTFAIMITYASFVVAGGNCVSSRAHLARAGVIAVLLAILGSFGLVSLCGVPFTNIVGIMPFLILGIGIDDTFVMMAGWTCSKYDDDVPSRLAETLKTSGISITLTSLTDFVAFLVGIISVFPSIRYFCIYTGVAVILCYVNHVTFFAGCLAIHGRREQASRHCVTCHTIYPRSKLKEQGASGCYACFCGGEPAKSREDSESICEKIPRIVLPKFILLRPVKAIVILVFLGYLGVSIYGTYYMKQGLILENLVSPESYYLRYSQWSNKYFETRFPVGFYVSDEVEYHKNATQTAIESLVRQAQSDYRIHDQFYLSWLEEYKRSPFYNDSSEEAFITGLKDNFLRYIPRFSNDVIFNENQTGILASRFYIQTENVKDSMEQGRSMLHLRELADESSLPVLPYAPPYIYFEQYVEVLPNTLLTVGVAIAAMFVISIIFMPNPLLVIYITIAISSILVGVVGFLYFWDLSLSSITMIHLVLSVGFSVDYCAHVCHAYMQSESAGRNARVANALSRTGGPILNGALSSLLGILLLVGSQSFVFSSFFKIMVNVISFGFLHAIFFLPVILSIIGPLPTGRGVSIEKIRVVPTVDVVKNGGLSKGNKEKDDMPQLTAKKDLQDGFERF